MLIEKKFIHELTPHTRKWFAKAIAGIIASDNVVDSNELKFLELTIQFLDSKEDVHYIVELVKEKKLPTLTQLRDINRPMAFRILQICSKVAINDLRFTKNEAAYLQTIAARLGFDKNFQKKFLSYANESAKVNKMLKELQASAYNSAPVYSDV